MGVWVGEVRVKDLEDERDLGMDDGIELVDLSEGGIDEGGLILGEGFFEVRDFFLDKRVEGRVAIFLECELEFFGV